MIDLHQIPESCDSPLQKTLRNSDYFDGVRPLGENRLKWPSECVWTIPGITFESKGE